jgi:hypothetical protein
MASKFSTEFQKPVLNDSPNKARNFSNPQRKLLSPQNNSAAAVKNQAIPASPSSAINN